ncbi:MAG: vitamin K epoxide reductase family protein [Gomphosphaeria aponina SAG 52.96 = DSM 107014]|uniref:Vitamin K epoxide reductase family protein n=1 Tax=Gomphosphaeria aponina SAG 52.96 = DSM 107014 TaxID=1521640 RepID=A0A941JVC9_9CHRO|nr:vitamin K epoxide reductase family protein [Gomphosphaeria aponina SAG 52.96 = DSM 107014]
MNRRRSQPWIYDWSRTLIGAIAIIGIILTAYLTVLKLTGGEVVCSFDAASPAAGCNSVLDSAYAYPFGRSGPPLSLIGFVAYIIMAIFALGPLFVNQATNRKLRKQLENWTWLLLLAGSTAMAAFSGYLMFVMATKLHAVCYYCMGSALFSFSLLVLSIIGHNWEDLGQIFFTGIIVALITLVGALGVYANVDGPVVQSNGKIAIESPSTQPQPPVGWEITTTSGEAEIALAKHLTAVGAKKYGAFWCPHCYEQKQLFGQEAFAKINYLECDPQGEDPQTQLCVDAGIQGFPSWEVNGELYPGTQTLERLAELSGYTGPMDFKYYLPGR